MAGLLAIYWLLRGDVLAASIEHSSLPRELTGVKILKVCERALELRRGAGTNRVKKRKIRRLVTSCGGQNLEDIAY